MTVSQQHLEAVSRGSRMLRTALGPVISEYLDDVEVVEVMLNPDGRLWIDRLTEGLCATDAHAAGSSMPWEAPLQAILESIEGPVAKIIAVMIIIISPA